MVEHLFFDFDLTLVYPQYRDSTPIRSTDRLPLPCQVFLMRFFEENHFHNVVCFFSEKLECLAPSVAWQTSYANQPWRMLSNWSIMPGFNGVQSSLWSIMPYSLHPTQKRTETVHFLNKIYSRVLYEKHVVKKMLHQQFYNARDLVLPPLMPSCSDIDVYGSERTWPRFTV